MAMSRARNWADHRWAQRRMSTYVDGDLGPLDERRFSSHVDMCPECGPMLRSLLGVVRALRQLPRQHPTIESMVVTRLRADSAGTHDPEAGDSGREQPGS